MRFHYIGLVTVRTSFLQTTVSTPRKVPDPGGPLMRTSIIGAKPPVHRFSPFPQITWHGNRHSRGLQGTSARAMASICVHRATRTPPGIAPGHIGSRDDLQEDHRPVTHGRADPASPFPAIHLTRQSRFYGSAGHIRSRDGIDLCPSSTANPSRYRSRAHPLARWFAGRSPTCHRPAIHSPQSLVSARALAFLQFIWQGNRRSTGLQGTSARAMASICVHRAQQTPPGIVTGHIGSRDVLQEDRRTDTHSPQSSVGVWSHAFLQFI